MTAVEGITTNLAALKKLRPPKSSLKTPGRCLEEVNVAAVENTVATELRRQGYQEGLRWWYADNVKQPTYEKGGKIARSPPKVK